MIGLMVIGVIVGYVLLAKFIVTKVLQRDGLKKANIALAIMILIPTWDIILGYPIYEYLCLTKAGVHIYKTVDDVEGFYIGEKDAQNEPYEPYKGYKYIEYQEVKYQKPTGKYYRSYWVNFWEDTQYSKLCVSPRRDDDSAYAKAVRSGHCIVKEEIAEGEVSRWEEKFRKELIFEIPVVKFKVYQHIEYLDRQTQEVMATGNSVWWQGGWIYGIFSSIEVGSGGTSCNRNLDYTKLENETLKPKKGEN